MGGIWIGILCGGLDSKAGRERSRIPCIVIVGAAISVHIAEIVIVVVISRAEPPPRRQRRRKHQGHVFRNTPNKDLALFDLP